MPDDDLLAAWGIAVLGPVDTAPVADAIRRAHERDAGRWYRTARRAATPESDMRGVAPRGHHHPHYEHDPDRGRTRVVVTRAGEERDVVSVTGDPAEAPVKVMLEYQRMAAVGALDPGIWRFTARTPERQSVELVVPERWDADSGAVEAPPGGDGPFPRKSVSENPVGRSSSLLDGLRPRLGPGPNRRPMG